jgi:hypothetical protein
MKVPCFFCGEDVEVPEVGDEPLSLSFGEIKQDDGGGIDITVQQYACPSCLAQLREQEYDDAQDDEQEA